MLSFTALIIFISITLIIILLIGYTLPNYIELHEELDIDSLPEKVFLQFADIRLMTIWNPWLYNIQKSDIILEGEPLSVCDKVSFKRKSNSYEKSIELLHIEMNKKIIFEFDFGFRNKGKMEIDLTQKVKGKTMVYWNFSLYLSNNPIERLYVFFVRNTYKKMMKIGLKNLKEKLESS
jgi:hypothetical protein